MKTLQLASRREWRRWLRAHHASDTEIWLVFHKRHTGRVTLGYEEAVEEALCVGWIDSLVRRLDDARYARKFTPRKPDSRWSTVNRRRYAGLEARGQLTAAGRRRPPTSRSGDAPRLPSAVPRDLERSLRAHPPAWTHFTQLAPSYRRHYVAWIVTAKRPETRARRLKAAIGLLKAGRKLGLK